VLVGQLPNSRSYLLMEGHSKSVYMMLESLGCLVLFSAHASGSKVGGLWKRVILIIPLDSTDSSVTGYGYVDNPVRQYGQ
jgi:hypothetical protein